MLSLRRTGYAQRVSAVIGTIALVVSAGCAASASREVASRPPVSRPAAPPLRPPESAAVRLARELDRIEIEDLSMASLETEEPCRGVAPPGWIVSGRTASGDAATCVASATQTACIRFAGHDTDHAEQVLCATQVESAARPAWIEPLVRLAVAAEDDWTIAPVPGLEAHPGLSLRANDGDYYALVKDGEWLASLQPIAYSDGRRAGPELVLDTSEATGDRSFGVVASSYSGGSGSGELSTDLWILSRDGSVLATRTQKLIGLFLWSLEQGDRERYPLGAYSLDARPHIEVALAAAIAPDGAIELSIERSHLPRKWRARFEDGMRCPPDTSDQEPGHGWDHGTACVLALRTQVGRWRVDGDRWSRSAPGDKQR